MAIINSLRLCNAKPNKRTAVSADYCYDSTLFQIRTYKDGDTNMAGGSTQNIQIDKELAKMLIKKLVDFIGQ